MQFHIIQFLNYIFIFNNSNEIYYYLFHRTILYVAVESQDIELVKLLLENDKIDINYPCVLKQNNFSYKISNQVIF